MPINLDQYKIKALETQNLVTRYNSALTDLQSAVNAVSSLYVSGIEIVDYDFNASLGEYPENPSTGDAYIVGIAGTIDGIFFPEGSMLVWAEAEWYYSLALDQSLNRDDDVEFNSVDASEYRKGGQPVREELFAERTYFVDAETGNDANDGLSSGEAFATIGRALQVVEGIDTSVYDVIIDVADGTYTESLTLPRTVGAGAVYVIGNEANPENVKLNRTSSEQDTDLIHGTSSVTEYHFRGMELEALTSVGGGATYHIRLTGANNVFFQNMRFGESNNGLRASEGALIEATGDFTIFGGGNRGWWAQASGNIRIFNTTITLENTPHFANAFCIGDRGGVATVFGNTFSGTDATGQRYDVFTNGVIFVNGAGETYLPGDVAGEVDSGGQYV